MAVDDNDLVVWSNTPGKVPSPAQMAKQGRLGINQADGRIFMRRPDGSVLDVLANALKATASNVQSVLDFIPSDLHFSIVTGIIPWTTDLSSYINTAVASSRANLYFPGTYPIAKKVSQGVAKGFIGDNVVTSQFVVSPLYDMGASAIIEGAVSASIDKIGIVCDQSGVTTRAGLKQYPWALNISKARRYTIGHLRICKAYKGVNAAGSYSEVLQSASGLHIDRLEVGAFHTGLAVDGMYDFMHANKIEPWLWDFASSVTGDYNNALMSIYQDGNTIGVEIGQVDGLDIVSLTGFNCKLLLNINSNSGAARQIGLLQLDGDYSTLLGSGTGDIQIGLLSSTKGLSPRIAPAFNWQSTGVGQVSSMRLWGSSNDQTMLQCSAGRLQIDGGWIQNGASSQVAILAAGGVLDMNHVTFDLVSPSFGRTASFLHAGAGGGAVRMTNCRANPTRTTATGNAFVVLSDRYENFIVNNDFGNWPFVYTNTTGGIYAPNYHVGT